MGAFDHLEAKDDHWCSGHLMMLAAGYVHADFRTPFCMPVENPFGPIDGVWFLYTGWPPLFALLLALYLKLTGPSLLLARILAAVLTTASALFVGKLSWAVSRHWLPALISVLIFATNAIILRFCTFVCNDTAALTCSLLMIYLYPRCVAQGGRRALGGYCLLVVLGCLLSWQCYLVPPACLAVMCCIDWTGCRASWRRHCLPVGVAVVTGLVLVGTMRLAEASVHQREIAGRAAAGSHISHMFLVRLGLGDPRATMNIVSGFFWNLYVSTHYVVMMVAAAAVIALLARRQRRGTGRLPMFDEDSQGRWFYMLALLAFPVFWCAFMPNMHMHDFQMIFWIPFLAVFSSQFVAWMARNCGRPSMKPVLGGLFLSAVAIHGAFNVHQVWQREDSPIFRDLEADVKSCTDPETLVVIEFEDRGARWRLQRPCVGMARRALATSRPHVLVTRLKAMGDLTNDYEPLIVRQGYSGHESGYMIWKPRQGLLIDGKGDQADELEEQLSVLWEGMDDTQRSSLNGIASDLNWLRRRGVPPPKGRTASEVTESQLRELRAAQDAEDWHAILHHLRVCAAALPQDLLAYNRAMCYVKLDFPQIAAAFTDLTSELSRGNGQNLTPCLVFARLPAPQARSWGPATVRAKA